MSQARALTSHSAEEQPQPRAHGGKAQATRHHPSDNPACRAGGELPASRKNSPANSYQTTGTDHAGRLPPAPWSKGERLPPLHLLPWDPGHSSLSQRLPSEIWEQPTVCQQLWPSALQAQCNARSCPVIWSLAYPCSGGWNLNSLWGLTGCTAAALRTLSPLSLSHLPPPKCIFPNLALRQTDGTPASCSPQLRTGQ